MYSGWRKRSSQIKQGVKTMKSKMSILIAGLLVALLVVGVIGATHAYAQSPSGILQHGRGPGDGRGPRLGEVELAAAAEALDMTTDELTTAFESGKTLEQIAEDAGVDFEDVQAAIQAAHATEMRERIQQAVDDGTITQENSDWLLEGLDKGFIGVPGGFGLGGPHGPGFGRGPEAQPTQQGTE
jgi:hypothetical protein